MIGGFNSNAKIKTGRGAAGGAPGGRLLVSRGSC